jgi:hypothetical protein
MLMPGCGSTPTRATAFDDFEAAHDLTSVLTTSWFSGS